MRPLFADLRALNHTKNVDRFYKIDVGQDLFSTWSVSLFYGRRGTKGTRRNLAFESREEAFAYAHKTLQNKKSFSKSRGATYDHA